MRRIPFTPPKVDMATNTGIKKAIGPDKVWDTGLPNTTMRCYAGGLCVAAEIIFDEFTLTDDQLDRAIAFVGHLRKPLGKKLIADVKNVKGKEVLDDFYSRAEKEGFENVKHTYQYKYYCHKTGELKTMCPSQVSV